FLCVGNDNDFPTSAGKMRGPDGTIVSYNGFDGYPANRVPAPLDSLNSENDTRILAYRLTITPGSAPVVPVVQLAYDGNGNTGGTAPTDASSPYNSNSTV